MSATAIKTKPNNIGRFAAIRVHGQILYGTIIDLVARTNQAKRIRIQRGDPTLAGSVVMPGQYDFLWYADEEED